AKTHNSLLVVTFDEDDDRADNHIPTIFFGAHVATGDHDERITHYTVLRTLQALTGVGCTGNSCAVRPISGIWR
ncbi:alkaline phosphatase family protein, partial [Micromonospora yasonensis]|nr:alkaline phosphatase family protein [Micromonospora yasonensis]